MSVFFGTVHVITSVQKYTSKVYSFYHGDTIVPVFSFKKCVCSNNAKRHEEFSFAICQVFATTIRVHFDGPAPKRLHDNSMTSTEIVTRTASNCP